MGAMLGLLMIYTGTIIGSAFLLTKPPAVSELGASELATVGLVSLVILVFFGVQQFVTLSALPNSYHQCEICETFQ